MISVVLYRYSGDSKIINKNPLLANTSNIPITGELLEDVDILNLSIIFEINLTNYSISDLVKYTYAYIEEFNRFYFVTNFRILENDLLEISFKSDVLYNFYLLFDRSICYVDIERSTDNVNYNPMIIDNLLPIDSERDILYKSVTATFNPFDLENQNTNRWCYSITYLGGHSPIQ